MVKRLIVGIWVLGGLCGVAGDVQAAEPWVFYGVKFAQSGDFAQLAELGIKHPVVVLRPGQSESQWESMLAEAERTGVKPIVWLYESEPHGCWNWSGSDWQFCSDGNRYLDFFEAEATKGEASRFLAVYGIHEGYHFGRTTAQQQSLYQKIKARAPHVKTYSKIYSDQSNNRDLARRVVADGGFAPGVCDYCGVLYHPFRIGDTDWEDSPGNCQGNFGSCKQRFLQDFATDKELIQNQGQSIFVANIQTLDWPSSGVYRMATAEEMREIGCYIYQQGADGLNWYSWGDNSGWQGLNHFPDRWPVVEEVAEGCGLAVTPTPTAPQSTPTPTVGMPTLTSPPQPTVTSAPVDCQLDGDYNGDGAINLSDYDAWRGDYVAGEAALSCFEYWRRASFALDGPTATPGQPTNTPTPAGPTATPGPTTPPGERKVKYYGVENVFDVADFDTLSQYGIDTIVAPIGVGNTNVLQQHYDAAVRNNMRIFIWPLGGGQCSFPWQGDGTSWDISAAHSMLDFMATHSDVFLGINIAHEPYYSCQFTNQEMETIRKEIKDYVKNKHNKDIIVTNKINGVTDSGNFAATGGVADLAEIWLHCTTGGQPDPNARGAEGTCQQAMERIKSSRETIDRNNWGWELLYHFQTFGMAIGGYTMPSAAEMREWGCKMIQSGDLDGFVWYDWDPETGNYNENLHGNRYDSTGEDRWEAVKYVKENCVR